MSSMHSDFNTKTNPELESEITEIIADLSLEEKVWMMSGHGFFKVFLIEFQLLDILVKWILFY